MEQSAETNNSVLLDARSVQPIDNAFGSVFAEEVAAARACRARTKENNTRRAYAGDARKFEACCWERDLEPLPARPEAVVTYLAALAPAGKADSTIARLLAALAWEYRQGGHVPPQHRDRYQVITDALAGIRRE
jgi:hypothetical protein